MSSFVRRFGFVLFPPNAVTYENSSENDASRGSRTCEAFVGCVEIGGKVTTAAALADAASASALRRDVDNMVHSGQSNGVLSLRWLYTTLPRTISWTRWRRSRERCV